MVCDIAPFNMKNLNNKMGGELNVLLSLQINYQFGFNFIKSSKIGPFYSSKILTHLKYFDPEISYGITITINEWYVVN